MPFFLGYVCVLTTQPDAEQHQEGRVITGPLVFGLFAVVEVAVHSLWWGEQVKHLPHGELKVHLFEVQEAAQVLVALSAGGVSSSIAGVQAAVGLFLWGVRCGGQHTDTRAHTHVPALLQPEQWEQETQLSFNQTLKLPSSVFNSFIKMKSTYPLFITVLTDYLSDWFTVHDHVYFYCIVYLMMIIFIITFLILLHFCFLFNVYSLLLYIYSYCLSF